ncbi:class I SAM-dependent methyltransferase [Streptomyces sp. NPDC051642]|uniref:class I SAM-dependent methyltransferase n=1 Tax=unclassified Streptomyces TaxID=2593676 RepID=UPI003419A228
MFDLGCGGGEWLLRVLATRPHLHAEGVDISEDGLTRAHQTASRLGIQERLVPTTRRPRTSSPRSRSTWWSALGPRTPWAVCSYMGTGHLYANLGPSMMINGCPVAVGLPGAENLPFGPAPSDPSRRQL